MAKLFKPCFIVLIALQLAACGTSQPASSNEQPAKPILSSLYGRTVNSAEGAELVAKNPQTGELIYGMYANQQQTLRAHMLPDFSYAGFKQGGVALPSYDSLPIAITLSPHPGDNYQHIQQAIDQLATQPLNEQGYRGVILLRKGHYQVSQQLRVTASGIIIRGEGQGDDGTIVTATSGEHRATLISYRGKGSGRLPKAANDKQQVPIAQPLVPVGANQFKVESTEGYRVGDEIAVVRTPNELWLGPDGVNTKRFGWKEKSYQVAFERTITAIESNTLFIDAPIVDAIEQRFGGGYVYRIDVSGRLTQVGLENLQLRTVTKANLKDENRAFYGVTLREVQHSWVRDVTAKYLSHAFNFEMGARFNTMQDVAFVEPNFEVRGGRHYGFNINDGSFNLIQRCYALKGRHNFVTGSRVTGPNVFLDCTAVASDNDSGPHHRWATGTLYDNTQGAQLNVQNRMTSGSGHGWTGAQQLFWNSDHDSYIVQAPPHAMNWAVGISGQLHPGRWSRHEASGTIKSHNQPHPIRSLYLEQLQQRLGLEAVEAITIPEQRTGTIWPLLQQWQGEGRLSHR